MSEQTGARDLPAGLLPVMTLMIFVVMMDTRAMTAMLPDIADDLDTTVPALGLAVTVFFLAYGTFQLAWGPISDRIGPVRVMSVAVVVLALAHALTPLVPGLGALIGVRVLAGAVAAAFFPLALATVGVLVPYERRQQVIAGLLAAMAIGQVMGAAVGGIVAGVAHWRVMYALQAAVAAAMILPLWRLRAAVAGHEVTGGVFDAHRRLLRNRRAVFVYLTVFVEGAGFLGGLSYLGALMHEEYGVSLVGVGLILMLDAVAVLVVSRSIGRIAPRFGEQRLIWVGGLLMAGAYLVAWAVGGWPIMLPAMVALGAGFALCHSTLQTRATTLDSRAPATAISLFAFTLFAGSALGTALLGGMLDVWGYDAVLVTAGLALLVVALAAPRLTAASPSTP